MDYYKSLPVPDEEGEFIDYEAFIPHSKMMPIDYTFAQTPVFQDLLDLKKIGKLPLKQAAQPILHDIRCLGRMESPSQFFFSFDKLASMKNEMELQMKSFFFEPAGEQHPPGLAFLIPPGMVKVGMAVVAFTKQNELNPLIRGYVEKIMDDTKCTVLDVDTGSIYSVYKKNLHFIPKFLAEYPVFAYRGKLVGVAPAGRGKDVVWSYPAKQIFIELATSGLIKAAVHYVAKDGTYAIYMKAVDAGDVWIEQELIERRMAVATSTFFDDLTDRADPDKNQDAWIIENIFQDMPSPRFWDCRLPDVSKELVDL